jgi:hypothetical protein
MSDIDSLSTPPSAGQGVGSLFVLALLAWVEAAEHGSRGLAIVGLVMFCMGSVFLLQLVRAIRRDARAKDVKNNEIPHGS